MRVDDMFQTSLLQIKTSFGAVAESVRNFENQSYHEHQFHDLEHHSRDLVDDLINLHEKSPIRTKVFQHLINRITRLSTSLLSYAKQIVNILNQDSQLTLSHKHYASQSALLAVYLKHALHDKQISLYTSQSSLKSMSNLLVDDKQLDKITTAKSLLSQEQIVVQSIEGWSICQFTTDVLIIDLFNLSPTSYLPFLFRHYTQLQKVPQVIIYHSHLQAEEVMKQLQKIDEHNRFWQVELSPQHPLEVLGQSEPKQMQQKLINFLKEDTNHPQKQDIIIFYPPDISRRKYIAKLNETLAKNMLRDHVNIIGKASQPFKRDKNNVIIAEGTTELQLWGYDYSNVIYVLDYYLEAPFCYSYVQGCYVKSVLNSTPLQKAKRMAYVASNRIGRYSFISRTLSQQPTCTQNTRQLSTYCLKMIDAGLSCFLDQHCPRVNDCLKLMIKLKTIEEKQGNFIIIDKDVVSKVKAGINLISARMIMDCLRISTISEQEQMKLANLIIMAVSILQADGNLRQSKQQIDSSVSIKPNGVWRKSGYLDSCLDILTKCELIENRQNPSRKNSVSQNIRRKTSKVNQQYNQIFGSLFEQIHPTKITFDQMQITDLVREYNINTDLLGHLRQQIDTLRQIFQVKQVDIQVQPEDIRAVLRIIMTVQDHSIALYSGSRRVGYMLNGEQNGVFPSKISLAYQLNQRPEILTLCRLTNYKGTKEILMCNNCPSDLYLEVFKSLPIRAKQSFSQIELQFHGISSTLFQHLWDNNIINRFQNEHGCFVQPNQQVAMIVIHCTKDKQQTVKSQFQKIIKKIRDKFATSSKTIHYLGNTNVVIGIGAAAKQIIKSDYINKCILSNLHLEVTKQDLEQLFEEFFVLKNIEVLAPEIGKHHKSAIIQFNSQRDYYLFRQYYNQCMYFDRIMDVKPLKGDPIKTAEKVQYIEFKWYVWKSHRKAIVRFSEQTSVQKAYEAFLINSVLDDEPVKVALTINQSKGQFMLTIQNLKTTTDQLFIYRALKGYGWIKEVQILKTPLKQKANEDALLQSLIRDALQLPYLNQGIIKMGKIEKLKNGLRVCRVNVFDLNHLNRIAVKYNGFPGFLGEGRLYAQSWFESPVLVPHGQMSIYQQIWNEVVSSLPEKPNVTTQIEQVGQNQIYIVIRGRVKTTVDLLHKKFTQTLTGYPIPLTQSQKVVILTDIGISNLLDIEQKYNCKLIVNTNKQTLSVLSKQSHANMIKSQIKFRISQKFFYRISLNSKTYKYFNEHMNKLKEIKEAANLVRIELECQIKSLILQGSAQQVQNAFNTLMHVIESLSTPEQEMINADVCGICCEVPYRPYRLQNCGHKFCLKCLSDSINSSLGDITYFPLKCPHCRQEIVIDDLDMIIDKPTLQGKVLSMAINKYVGLNPQILTFCFTAGCKQINAIMADSIRCDVCGNSYCLKCKGPHHPNMTCQEAKGNNDQVFKKYMKENGIRTCPNKACKVPLVRIDGCYRVTCSRCNKSMCFKCDADKMIAYDDYNECYKHLNDVHGGYW